MNNRAKMYRSNASIKAHLKELGFTDLYLFPHSRFMKDYIFKDLGFDAMGWKQGEKCLWLFQFKTNMKCPKAILEQYRRLADEYYVKCMWVTKFDRKKVECYY
jgi:hypothetical protein